MFEVIPAIDLLDGRCVRLVQGDYQRSTVYGDDPVAMARHWEAAGATRIHVVDLNGSKAGCSQQLNLVGQIAATVAVPVQLGGGLRSVGDLSAAFDAGLDRAILGTAAFKEPDLVDRSIERFGNRVAVGIDARDGNVAVSGWSEVSTIDALSFARDMAQRGVRTIVYTDIARDGMLAGANHQAVAQMVEAVPDVVVIASGGVTTIHDLVQLCAAGARGAIVGKALYTGAVDLAAAMSVVASC